MACEKVADDAEVRLRLFDEGHVTRLLEDGPARVGDLIGKRLDGRRRRFVKTPGEQERGSSDRVETSDDAPVAKRARAEHLVWSDHGAIDGRIGGDGVKGCL